MFVTFAEPFDPQRVGATYELTPTAESTAPGGSRFPHFSQEPAISPPLHESTLPSAGPYRGSPLMSRLSPHNISEPPPAAPDELTLYMAFCKGRSRQTGRAETPA